METNRITEKIIGCAREVHRHPGPGLLESAYEECSTYKLNKAGMKAERQKPVPVIYKKLAWNVVIELIYWWRLL